MKMTTRRPSLSTILPDMTMTARHLRALVKYICDEDLTRHPEFIEGWKAAMACVDYEANPYDQHDRNPTKPTVAGP
jgi:hypothetical protein